MKHLLYGLLVGLFFVPVYGSAQVGFNKVGYINSNLPTDSLAYNSVVIDSNNKIVVVGETDDNNGLIARYNQDGTLDTTFNNGLGYKKEDNININSLTYNSVAIDNNNKILVLGQTDQINNNFDGLIVRYNQDGSLDRTFNTPNGFINVENGTDSASFSSVVIDRNNKILVVGRTDNIAGIPDGLIVRYNQDGSLDQTFNNNGFMNVENGTDSQIFFSVAIDRNNKILVVGATDNPGNISDGLIARYNENGSLDTTFNNGLGYINANLPTASSYFSSVVIDSNNKIIVVGQTDNFDGLIARYNENGTLDTTFNAGSINGGPGYINQEGNTDSWVYNSVIIDNNNKIVVVGYTDDNNGLIARYNENGTLDTTFNAGSINGGVGYINQEGNTDSWVYSSVVIDNNHKILVAGRNDADNGILARYLSNGVLDAEYNWNLKNYRESAYINNVSIGILSGTR